MPLLTGPRVGASSVTFEVADPDHAYRSVRLWQEVRVPGDRLDFTRYGGRWVLRLQRPPVQRMEYLLELTSHDGGRALVTDPANPAQVDGAFGCHSVVEFPDYAAPAWLDASAVDSTWSALAVPGRALKAAVSVRLWSPATAPADQPLPLLVAHDGPEYNSMSRLSQYSGASIASGALPLHRLALLAPGERNEWYSASSAYASALTAAVLPALANLAPTRGPTVGMGASLGALAMLHAQRRHPGAFGALFLQSGSFFRPRLDGQEAHFSRYQRIVRFVSDTLRAASVREAVPVTMTCGTIEENITNNRLMVRALGAQGYDARLDEVPDVHNYTAWRDAFDPHLTNLLRRVWCPAADDHH